MSFTDICKSCPSREFLESQICLLMLFVKIKFSRKFLDLQYVGWKSVSIWSDFQLISEMNNTKLADFKRGIGWGEFEPKLPLTHSPL